MFILTIIKGYKMAAKKVTNKTLNDFPVSLWDEVKKICKRKYPGIKIKTIVVGIFEAWVKAEK